MKKATIRFLASGLFFGALFFISFSLAAGSRNIRPPNPDGPVVVRSVKADYDQVWDDLTAALNNRGLVISSVSHVGEMLKRTGQALHAKEKLFARANVMEFCSAVISRQMMHANPHYIAFCPYQIMVYSLPDAPGTVYLGYRRLLWDKVEDREPLQAVENLLEGLIDEVIRMQREYQ